MVQLDRSWRSVTLDDQETSKSPFELDVSDWHGHGSETLWAEPIAENEQRILQIRNSPFFAKGINNLDVVKAKFTDDVVGDFIEVIERGGHSTYMLLMQPAEPASSVLSPTVSPASTWPPRDYGTSPEQHGRPNAI
jgi:hypothetical protein